MNIKGHHLFLRKMCSMGEMVKKAMREARVHEFGTPRTKHIYISLENLQDL